MKLYYKEWDKPEVQIPENSVILSDSDLGGIHWYLFYPKIYCWEIWIIHKILRNTEGYFDFTKNMVDIGAGIGEYCWELPFNHAYAFEPNKETIYRIHANALMKDKVDQIDTFQCLLSDKVETVAYDGYYTDIGGHIDYNTNQNTKQTTDVLDSFSLNNVGFIKIDVEGMEEKVLRGGIGTIVRNNYPPILFECWDVGYSGMTQEKHDSLFSFLRGLGYEILEYWGDGETHLAIHK